MEWIIDLNVKRKDTRLLQHNKGDNLDDLGFGNDFLDSRMCDSCTGQKRRQQKLPDREGSDVRFRKYFERTIIN